MHYGESVEWPGALIKDIIDIVNKVVHTRQ